MSDPGSVATLRDREAPLKQAPWLWHPPLPLEGVPVLVSPPNPVKALKYFFSVGFLWSVQMPYAALAVITWLHLQPALERSATFKADWILQMLARNLGRGEESLRVVTLGALSAADADMLTLVLIGSSATRRIERGDGGVWVYTPRGYQAKS